MVWLSTRPRAISAAIGVTPWQVLGVPPGAPRAEAERAYRRRMKRAHPDAGGSTAEATALNQAIARVRMRPRTAPSAGMARSRAATPPRAAAWLSPEPTAASSGLGRRESRSRPRWASWLVATGVALAGLVLLIVYWQMILLAIATLLAIAIILSACTE